VNEDNSSFLWDAETYDKVSDTHEKWARKIILSKIWTGKEIIMDAGCGSGRITKILSEIVPIGKVYAIDNDENMIDKAKNNLKDFKNVIIIKSNLLDIDFNKTQSKFNIIFSNAVLHWILDHYKAFKNFYDLLVSDGQILIQCGGYGNLQKAISIFNTIKESAEFKEFFSKWKDQWNFAKPVDTKEILKEIGYKDINVYLEDYPVTFKDKNSYSTYLKTVVLGPYLKYLPSEKLQDNFLQRIIQIKEDENNEQRLTLDYKRLNIFATKT
jgi:trans-aconitate 2-methyltransferase